MTYVLIIRQKDIYMTISTVFFITALACILGVAVSLFAGMVAMTKGGEKDNRTSNKMMRLRVLFQGLAIFFLLLAYLAK